MINSDVIVITGPTATGKSALGASVAKKLGGEVVSADSMQVYKHMDIGTAKPTEQEMLGIPHHMFDVVSPMEDYSVSRYVEDAARCIDDIIARGKLPVLVGGTGLYIESLLSGRWFSPRGQEDLRDLRTELEERYDRTGGEDMLAEMRGFDAQSAARLHANDKKRIVRAFEIYKTSGKTISQHDRETQIVTPRYSSTKVALNYLQRSALYGRIERRVDDMLAAGFSIEVQSLLDMGVPIKSTAMQAIGYKELASAITGKSAMDETVGLIKQRSRNYAKRQLTWFRRDESINWIYWEKSPDIELAVSVISNLLQA